MVDWTELEKLHAEFMSATSAVGDYDPAHAALASALISALPAILSERRAMKAKLEAAQRLSAAVRARKALATRIKESGPAPHSDYWGQSIHEADKAVEDALAAIDAAIKKQQ